MCENSGLRKEVTCTLDEKGGELFPKSISTYNWKKDLRMAVVETIRSTYIS